MKTKQDLLYRMESLRACSDATIWVQSQDGTSQDIWDRCERGDWMLWYAAQCKSDPRLIGRAAALCVQETLQYVPAGEDRPRKCVETVLAWSRGEATIEQVMEARRDAYAYVDAYAYAYASDAYAYAYAYASAAAAAAAAAYAAYAYAYAYAYASDAAAYASNAAAYADARSKSLARSAKIVRSVFPEVPK